jgi:glutamate racemase
MSAGISTAVPRVGVFDSGVGGLTVLAAIRRRLPGIALEFCSDNAHFPYGTRTEEDLLACVLQSTKRFIAQTGIDILVVACNTASTVVLPALRTPGPGGHAVEVVGVVPAIKPAAQQTRTGVIGILATPGTVKRPYLDDLIRTHAPGCKVLRVGSRVLVELAERKLRGEVIEDAAVAAEARGFFEHGAREGEGKVDVVVLGCTHFPHLVPELERTSPWPVRWIDSGPAIAARVEQLLLAKGHELGAMTEPGGTGGTAWFTAEAASVAPLAPALASPAYGLQRLAVLA